MPVCLTRFERFPTMKSAFAALSCSAECVVSKAKVLQPAAFPLRIPDGASSTTRPGRACQASRTKQTVQKNLQRLGSTPQSFAPRRYGSGLSIVSNKTSNQLDDPRTKVCHFAHHPPLQKHQVRECLLFSGLESRIYA